MTDQHNTEAAALRFGHAEAKLASDPDMQTRVETPAEQIADLRRQLEEAQALTAQACEALKVAAWKHPAHYKLHEVTLIAAVLADPSAEAAGKWLEDLKQTEWEKGYDQGVKEARNV